MNECIWRIIADNDEIKEMEHRGTTTFNPDHPCRHCDGRDLDCSNYTAENKTTDKYSTRK